MPYKLISNSIYLRLVSEEDASFICDLRNQEKLNAYISKSTDDVTIQKQWIKNYKDRESDKIEFYFIICRNHDDLPIGTVRLYDFKENKSFCWGSWLLNENKTPSSALESMLLVYEFAFSALNFNKSHFDVMKGNEKVHSFHLKTGAQPVSEDALNVYYTFSKEQHEKNKKRYAKFLKGKNI